MKKIELLPRSARVEIHFRTFDLFNVSKKKHRDSEESRFEKMLPADSTVSAGRSVPSPKGLAFCGDSELRVGFLAVFANIQPFELFFFADANAHGGLDDAEHD